jgi:hypothetical protein
MQNNFRGTRHSTYRRLGLGKISLGRIIGDIPTSRLYYGAGTVPVFRVGIRKKLCDHYRYFKYLGNGIA